MKPLLLIACLFLTSCVDSLWLAAYRHQGRDPKPKYVPVVRDFGGINGREVWLYSPSQLKP